MKATIVTESRKVFECIECNKPFKSSYEHLSIGQSFGPWYCDHCGCGIRGEITGDGIELLRDKERKAKTLVLLRLDAELEEPIHIVVEGAAFYPEGGNLESVIKRKQDLDAYYYDEHTCPWNYLRVPIKKGNDADPHGIFVHQETILMPDGYDRIEVDDIEAWRELFPSLKEPNP